jgi:hypothetical protein
LHQDKQLVDQVGKARDLIVAVDVGVHALAAVVQDNDGEVVFVLHQGTESLSRLLTGRLLGRQGLFVDDGADGRDGSARVDGRHFVFLDHSFDALALRDHREFSYSLN